MLQRHSLHALVFSGSVVVFGCGGVVSKDTESSGSPEAGGSIGAGAEQGSGGSGGTFFLGAGGVPTSGAGAFPTGAGGAVGGAAGGFPTGGGGTPSTEPGPIGCKPAQWDCYSATCDQQVGLNLVGAGCLCDEGRPASSADCKPDETFVCDQGYFRSDGVAVPLNIQCRCVAGATDCGACAQTFIGAVVPTTCEIGNDAATNRTTEILCGCALATAF